MDTIDQALKVYHSNPEIFPKLILTELYLQRYAIKFYFRWN
jgi:hypothetical protein